MNKEITVDQAAELLQELGLKEYEARCFVGLVRVHSGTAKQLSEITDVPRTRIYDAIRVLEAQGLVEVQHSNPQRFRAVPVEEAVHSLRKQYEDRVDRFGDVIEAIDPIDEDNDTPVQEVWALTGKVAIANRAAKLIESATEEVVLVLGNEALLTPDLVDQLNSLPANVDVIIGAVSEDLSAKITAEVPAATSFVSGLDWLSATESETAAIGRLLLVDRSKLLVSTYDAENETEHATYGSGFGNGFVVVSRRLLAQGLLPERDPG